MSRFWVLTYLDTSDDYMRYYAGDLKITADIQNAFKYGTKELAEEFKTRHPSISNFAAVEYELEYKKVGR